LPYGGAEAPDTLLVIDDEQLKFSIVGHFKLDLYRERAYANSASQKRAPNPHAIAWKYARLHSMNASRRRKKLRKCLSARMEVGGSARFA